ncbi:OmpA family protein [Moheibacter sediminis]|uniref:OmpA family protein n=1 Tax=Moheibacter sediminis TaxID=1434700 RepID=A0A1W1YEK6_9FLAO|nr:OmpA family protein [Moheibacter sediminis]SMC34564.1 OmpA family protein [Moheibacter sediminis]
MKKTKFLFTAILLTLFSQIFAQIQEVIYFDKNSFLMNESEKINLEKFANAIKSDENKKLEIKGFSDSDGDTKMNLQLSKKRVQAVHDFLLVHGIKKDQIKLSYFGEENPVGDNQIEEGKQKNRRVEVDILNPKSDKLAIYSRFKKKPQIFTAVAKENVEIKGNEGTVIKIPKYSLINSKNKTVIGEVKIFLEEYYTNSDIIKANLHTLSDRNILETGGMIHIVIKYKNEELKLKKDKEIEIEFATDDMERMEIFVGETKGEKFNWKLEKSKIPELSRRNNSIEMEGDIISFDTIKRIQPQQNNIVNKYLTSNNLFWINCDRFLNAKKEDLTDLKVRTNISAEVKLVFKKINSIMPPVNFQSELYEFINLPKQSKTTIIAFTEIDGEPYYASKEITIGEMQTENLNLVKITWEGLEKEFKILDNPNRKNYNEQNNIIIE